MPGLSNIFSDSDNSSSDGNASNDVMTDVTNTIGLDADSNQTNWSQDEDGNTSYNNNENSIGLDSDTDGLLGSVTDAMGSSEQSDD
jgi:hypothetical protein